MGKRQAPRKLDALSEDSDSVNFSGDENSVDLTAAKSSTVPDCDETNAVRNCAVRKSGKRRKSRHEVLARHRDDLLFVHDRKDTSASMEKYACVKAIIVVCSCIALFHFFALLQRSHTGSSIER